MRIIIFLTWTCLGLAALILIAVNLLIGYWQLALTTLVLLILWGWGVHWKRRWAATASLVGLSLELASGVLLDLGIGWLVVSMVSLLVAWDLQWFDWRIGAAEQIIGEKELVLSHLSRIAVVASIGILLAMVTLFIHIKFSFGIAILLGLLVILGLRQWILIAKRSVV